MLLLHAWPHILLWGEKSIDNKFIVEGISFETVHGKLNFSHVRKKKCFLAYLKGNDYSQYSNFLRRNIKRNFLREGKDILSIKRIKEWAMFSEQRIYCFDHPNFILIYSFGKEILYILIELWKTKITNPRRRISSEIHPIPSKRESL